MDLIADVGATNSRCALLDDQGQVAKSESFENADFTGLPGLLRIFLEHRRASDQPKRAAIAVAAPVTGDQVVMTNIAWQFSQAELRQELGLSRLMIVNDFAAQAWALPTLGPGDCHQVGSGTGLTRTTLAVIGPGSGLGVATLTPSGDGWTALSGEGGHVTLPAETDREAALIEMMREEHGHCSAERLLSGPGLVRIYMGLARLAGRESAQLQPADVTALADQGEPLAKHAFDCFFDMLGTIAGNLALTVGAKGGVYIAGGIVPRMLNRFEASGFRERFEAKGRYRGYLSAIPTYVVTDPVPAFRGLRSLLGYR